MTAALEIFHRRSKIESSTAKSDDNHRRQASSHHRKRTLTPRRGRLTHAGISDYSPQAQSKSRSREDLAVWRQQKLKGLIPIAALAETDQRRGETKSSDGEKFGGGLREKSQSVKSTRSIPKN